jgi:hypothetical protein
MSGLLSRLRARRTAAPLVVHATVYPGDETLEVVGESRYQEALWEIAGGSATTQFGGRWMPCSFRSQTMSNRCPDGFSPASLTVWAINDPEDQYVLITLAVPGAVADLSDRPLKTADLAAAHASGPDEEGLRGVADLLLEHASSLVETARRFSASRQVE